MGVMVDYSYSFTRYARLTLGGRWISTDPDVDYADADDSVAWWGVSFTAGF